MIYGRFIWFEAAPMIIESENGAMRKLYPGAMQQSTLYLFTTSFIAKQALHLLADVILCHLVRPQFNKVIRVAKTILWGICVNIELIMVSIK